MVSASARAPRVPRYIRAAACATCLCAVVTSSCRQHDPSQASRPSLDILDLDLLYTSGSPGDVRTITSIRTDLITTEPIALPGEVIGYAVDWNEARPAAFLSHLTDSTFQTGIYSLSPDGRQWDLHRIVDTESFSAYSFRIVGDILYLFEHDSLVAIDLNDESELARWPSTVSRSARLIEHNSILYWIDTDFRLNYANARATEKNTIDLPSNLHNSILAGSDRRGLYFVNRNGTVHHATIVGNELAAHKIADAVDLTGFSSIFVITLPDESPLAIACFDVQPALRILKINTNEYWTFNGPFLFDVDSALQ